MVLMVCLCVRVSYLKEGYTKMDTEKFAALMETLAKFTWGIDFGGFMFAVAPIGLGYFVCVYGFILWLYAKRHNLKEGRDFLIYGLFFMQLSMLVHESIHVTAYALFFGELPLGIILGHQWGGAATAQPDTFSLENFPRSYCITAFVGPASNLLIAGYAWKHYHLSGSHIWRVVLIFNIWSAFLILCREPE